MNRSTFVMDTGTKHSKFRPMNFNSVPHSAFPSAFGLVKTALLLMGILLSCNSVAQGWELTFGGNKQDEATAVAEAIDGGFILVGFGESFGDDNDQDIIVYRTDIDGKVLWNQVYDEGFMEQAFDVLSEPDGTFLVVGNVVPQQGDAQNVLLLRLSKEGKPLWAKTYSAANREVASSIIRSADGGFLIAGTADDDKGNKNMLLIKVAADGALQWRKTYGSDGDDYGEAVVAVEDGYFFAGNTDQPDRIDNDIVLYKIDKSGQEVWDQPMLISTDEVDEVSDLIATSDGGLMIAGRIGFNSDAYIAKLSMEGKVEWEQTIGGALGDGALDIHEVEEDLFVMVGFSEISETNLDMLVAAVDAQGNELWRSTLGESLLSEEGRQIVPTRDGRYAIAGLKSDPFSGVLYDMLLAKTDGQGNTITNYVVGKVYRDRDEGCNGYDLTRDVPLEDWLVQVSNKATGTAYYGLTDEEGNYRVRVDTGDYNVQLLPANSYWKSCVETGYEITLAAFYDTIDLNFPVLPEIDCPLMEVNVSAPFNVPCEAVTYQVTYCNNGTTLAEGAYVEITLDEKMTFVEATPAPASQQGRVLTFQLGDVAPTECGSFAVTTSTEAACTEGGVFDGEAVQVSAHIYPDSLCAEPDSRWDRSRITVAGDCNENRDSVKFLIRNVGVGNMSQSRQSIVIQDDVIILLQGQDPNFRLNSGEDKEVPIRAEEGSTYRIIAFQDQFFPGSPFATTYVEGCVTDGEPVKTGFVTQFPEADQDPAVAIDIQELTASNQPIAMRGYPKAYGEEQIIASNTDITYTVLFQNVGADTVRRVVIRDTLSENLDITTVTPGVASHPYNFEIYDNGTLRITFSDIELLPAGNAGASASYGFVKFKVSQKPELPEKTRIDNRAAVFFDYHEPALTNLVRYFTGDFPSYLPTKIITSIDEVFWPGVEIKVYPNPFIETTVINIEGYEFKEVILNVFDAGGRLLTTSRHQGNEIMYYRNALPTGLYFFRLESEGQLISSGKMLVR